MLLLKKLCKKDQQKSVCNRGNNNNDAYFIEVPSTAAQTNTFARLNCINVENKHLAKNRPLRSLPPIPTAPSFSIAVTSSTLANVCANTISYEARLQRQQDYCQLSLIKQPQEVEVLHLEQQQQPQPQPQEQQQEQLIRHVVDLGLTEQRQKLIVANNRRCTIKRNVATVSTSGQQVRSQKQQQQQLYIRRKRSLRFHQLLNHQQKQRQQKHSLFFVDPYSTSEDSSSESKENTVNTAFKPVLKDVYSPDLLNACSLILQPEQSSDDSSIYSYTSNNQYEEIAKNQNGMRDLSLRSTSKLSPYSSESCLNDFRKVTTNQRLTHKFNEMGQSLSLRRPRISLTWVLREQQQQQQQDTQKPQQPKEEEKEPSDKDVVLEPGVSQTVNNNELEVKKSNSILDLTSNHLNDYVGTKKHLNLPTSVTSNEPLNGYATTPSAHIDNPSNTHSLTQKFFSNKNLLQYHREEMYSKPASKDLLFVCTPQTVPESLGGSTDALAFAKKRNEIRKKLAAKKTNLRYETMDCKLIGNEVKEVNLTKEVQNFGVLKTGSFSEPSLIAASEGNPRRHRHRKRRERNRHQKFGYEIRNVDEFLIKCTLATPANIPMVLSTSSTLYQTRPGGYQTELSLPLGMVVNAVFKNQQWLYVQTPHGEEGYVSYPSCLPLGILPPEARGQGVGSAKPPPCWESNGDVFPRPCGNMTDSEKELNFIGGARSEGARTPHLKPLPPLKTAEKVSAVISKRQKENVVNGNLLVCGGEHQLDKLYLKAASHTHLNDIKPAYAQLKVLKTAQPFNTTTTTTTAAATNPINDEYVVLQKQHQQQPPPKFKQKSLQLLTNNTSILSRTLLTNGYNGQHLHPKDMNTTAIATAATTTDKIIPIIVGAGLARTEIISTQDQQQQQQQQQQYNNCKFSSYNHHNQQRLQQQQIGLTSNQEVAILHHHHHQHQHPHHHSQANSQHPHHYQQQQQLQQHHYHQRTILNALRRSSAHCAQRQTLVAITIDHTTGDGLNLRKGDIVTLCECRETKDHRQWFYVRTRDGRQGYIPAEVAGHGYL